MESLTPLQIHALACLAKSSKQVRGKLKVGTHKVDFGLQIAGTVTVSGDQTQQSNSKPDATTIAALLLGTYGPRKRLAIVQQILSGNKKDALNDDLRVLADDLISALATKSSSTRKGSVNGSLDVAVID